MGSSIASCCSHSMKIKRGTVGEGGGAKMDTYEWQG
jgi:hypothetical protein